MTYNTMPSSGASTYVYLNEMSSGPIKAFLLRVAEAIWFSMIMLSGFTYTGTPFTYKTTASSGFETFWLNASSSGPVKICIPRLAAPIWFSWIMLSGFTYTGAPLTYNTAASDGFDFYPKASSSGPVKMCIPRFPDAI